MEFILVFFMKEEANIYRKVITVKNQTLILSSPVECSRKCVWFVNVTKQDKMCEVYQATFVAVSGVDKCYIFVYRTYSM